MVYYAILAARSLFSARRNEGLRSDNIEFRSAVRKPLLRTVARSLRPRHVDVTRTLGGLEKQQHLVVMHLEETPARRKQILLPIRRPYGNTAGLQRREERRMMEQHLESSLDAGGAHTYRLRAQYRTFRVMALQGKGLVKHERTPPYAAISFLARSMASSIPPTIIKACSGRSSYSPSQMPLNPRMVSLQLHVLAGTFRNGSSDGERLREEPLDLPRPGDRELVIIATAHPYRECL